MKRFSFAALALLLGLMVAGRAQSAGVSAPLPPCADLFNADLRVRDAEAAVTDGAIYCRPLAREGKFLVNPGQLGNPDVVAGGVQEAYDVYGLYQDGTTAARFENRVEVCLQGRGTLIYLPAFASPRPAQTPLEYLRGDYTCAYVGSPGIVALQVHAG